MVAYACVPVVIYEWHWGREKEVADILGPQSTALHGLQSPSPILTLNVPDVHVVHTLFTAGPPQPENPVPVAHTCARYTAFVREVPPS